MSSITSKRAQSDPSIINLRVVDLPGVKKIRVTYHYPSWTGMKDAVEDPGGDLRAVEGTEAEVAIQTDRPLNKGVLMLGDDQQVPARIEGRELAHRSRQNRQGRPVSRRRHRSGRKRTPHRGLLHRSPQGFGA